MLKRFIKDFSIGIKAYFRAFFFLFDHNLWIYFSVPVLLFVVMYMSADYVHQQLIEFDFKGQLQQIDFQKELRQFKWFKWSPADSEEIKLILLSVQIIYVVAVLRLKRYLILILMSPVLAFVSSKIEYALVENKYAWDTKQFIKDIYRAVNFSVRNMFRQAIILGTWFLLVALFNDLDNFSWFVSFMVGSYYYGASLMDYTNERRRLSWEESISYLRSRYGMTLAIGMVFYSMFIIEFFGFIVAPIAGVVAATLAIHVREDLSDNKYAVREVKSKNQPKTTAEKYKNDPWLNG